MPTKRALLIGINAYAHIRTLDGCVNDVKLMRSVLADTFGFADQHITVLLDDQATRAGILAAFDALVAATGPDDIVVIQYAGHGSQMTDREGDEPSGFDSTLMPFDTARAPGENRDITDDEIHLKLEALAARTRFTTLIIDACHSGTITRDAFGTKVRAVEADRRPVSELPKSPIPHAQIQRTRSGASGWMPLGHSYVLIAGCSDDEESAEYRPPGGGGTHGALTYFLCQELRQSRPGTNATSGASGTPATTYRDVFERVAARVNGNNRAQHPQMEGQADREIFGVVDVAPVPFVSVTERTGSSVVLGAGSAHGLTVGSTYGVYAQGTKDPAGQPAIGDMEIASVRAFTADARVTREDARHPIGPGARAFESAHAFGDFRLAVQLVASTGPEATRLREGLSASRRLKVVSEDGEAAVRIYLLPAREMSPSMPVPQAGALDTPRWAVVSDTGDLLMKLKTLGDESIVIENLEKVAKYRRVLATENSDPRGGLRGKFALELLRRGRGGDWTVTEPETDGGQIVFAEGEEVAFRITNRHNADAYIALVDIGLAGDVSVVCQGVKLSPNTPFTLSGNVSFPEGYPFVDLADDLRGAEGLETLKLFVTRQSVNFSGLEQTGVRSAAAPASSLADLLQGAVSATALRDFKPAPVATDDWTTVSRAFVVRRHAAALPEDGARVAIGNATVSAPTLTGTVGTGLDASGRDESEGFITDALQQAFAAASVEPRQTIQIAGAQERRLPSRGASEQPGIELRLRDPAEGYGQMVLAADELGVVSWCFASSGPATRSIDGSAAGRTYVIPSAVPADSAPRPGTRGVIGLVGKKVLKELVFPLIDPVLGEVSATFVNRLEAKRWPYRVRTFTPDDYARDEATAIDRDGWSRLGAGRALLMVHGTFSRTHLAFAQLPKDYVEELHRIYGGRVFAFDHFTLSHDPKENVRRLVSQMPDHADLTLDIVCHSRGGLVSRLLSEKQSELSLGGRRLRIGKIVMVGAPNAGTALADAEHVATVLDVFTNLMNFLPDNGVIDVMTMIVEAAKLVAVGALGGLDGLRAMRPQADFAQWLNTGAQTGDTKYFAVASDVTPSDPGLRHLALARGLNQLLRGANDFVVPAESVFAANGSGFFPVEERLVLEGADAAAHTQYFADARVRRTILGWLNAR